MVLLNAIFIGVEVEHVDSDMRGVVSRFDTTVLADMIRLCIEDALLNRIPRSKPCGLSTQNYQHFAIGPTTG